VTTTVQPPPVGVPDAGVIDDARERQRHQRRRGMIGLVVLASLGGVAAIAALVISGRGSPTTTGGGLSAAGLPTGTLATLHVAGKLAVGPNGALYVADVGGDRILVRLPDGRFRVVAGDGKVGFSGDGGPAVRAELSSVSDLSFAPDGALYVADGGRVRVIGRNGVIRTIAGDGRQSKAVANGTPALSGPLGSTNSMAVRGDGLSIAFSPRGQLYISTGSQVLRLTNAGTLATVRAVATSGLVRGSLRDFGPIAIDGQGNIDLAGSFTGWSIWQIAPSGAAREVGFARQTGGDFATLERDPNGVVYAEDESTIARIESLRLVPTFRIGFPLIHFAFGPHGTFYADDYPGGTAFEKHQKLVSVHNSHISLLWREKNATPK